MRNFDFKSSGRGLVTRMLIALLFMAGSWQVSMAQSFMQSDDGLVVISAESYDSIRGGSKGDAWADSTTFDGYFGSGYMQGNMDGVYADGADAAANAPALSYYVNFTQTGTHYIWAHKYFIDGSNDSYWYGVNGTSIARIQSGTTGVWEWKKGDASFEIAEAGVDTISIYLRERGAIIDHIIITTDDTFDPSADASWMHKNLPVAGEYYINQSNLGLVLSADGDQPISGEKAATDDQIFTAEAVAGKPEVYYFKNKAGSYLSKRGDGTNWNTAFFTVADTLAEWVVKGDMSSFSLQNWNNLTYIREDRSYLQGGGAAGESFYTDKTDPGTNGVYNLESVVVDNPFIPALPGVTNLVPDPECTNVDLFGGWGLKSVVTDEAFSGGTSIKLTCTVDASCGYPDAGAALDVPFTYKANTTYRLVAMVKTVGGSIGFLANGSDPNFGFAVDTEGEWMMVDTTFTTGANAGTNFFSFNTCDFGSDAEETYIDNYQFYELPVRNVIFVTKSEEAIDTLAIQAIDAHAGFSVTPYYPAGGAGVITDADLDALNAGDVVIMGRNIGSSDVGASMAAWDKVTAPVLSMNLWGMRNNRAMWIDNGGATNVTDMDTVLQATVVNDDPILGGMTGTFDLWSGAFSSFVADGDDTDHGNGQLILEAVDGTPLLVRWDAGVEFYPGAAHSAMGIRTFIGNGNDDTNVNYFGFTEEGKKVFFNELERMAAIGSMSEMPAKDVLFVTKSDVAIDTLAIQAIDANPGFNVIPFYPASGDGTLAQADVDAIHAANPDVVIMGRNIGSSQVGNAMAEWDKIFAPVLSMNLWGMRSNRAMWIDNASAVNVTEPRDTVLQATLVGTDDIFGSLSGTLNFWNGPFSAFGPDGDDTDHGNGTLLASAADGTPLMVRWDAETEFYPGAGHSAKGIRTFIGNGNDQDSIVYFGFTDEGASIFFNELERMSMVAWEVPSDDDDGDGVPNDDDVCPGEDDNLDADSDGVPDGCDMCEGSDDSLDADSDGIPDGCDVCAEGDDTADADEDGVPDACDLCAAGPDNIDVDKDGIPDACDDDLPELKTIAFIGAYEDIASYDKTLHDSLAQYVKVHYIPSGIFNAASYDSLYTEETLPSGNIGLGLEGIFIGESIGSGDMINFGPARDAFPVPSISFEAGTYTNSWGDEGFMQDNSAGIWGYGGANEEAVDLQWKIVDPFHESVIDLGWQQDQIVTWSDATPERGIPYLHGFNTTVNVIAVGARESGATAADPAFNPEWVQEQAVAVAEFPIQRSYYANVARAYHDTDPVTGESKATQDFWDFVRWSTYYMFDAYPSDGVILFDPMNIGSAFQVYPNPSVGAVNLSFVAANDQNIDVKIVSLSGQLVYETSLQAKAGRNRLPLDLTSKVESGVYFVNTVIDGEKAVKRLIIK